MHISTRISPKPITDSELKTDNLHAIYQNLFRLESFCRAYKIFSADFWKKGVIKKLPLF